MFRGNQSSPFETARFLVPSTVVIFKLRLHEGNVIEYFVDIVSALTD
jgi:hypothetical protein